MLFAGDQLLSSVFQQLAILQHEHTGNLKSRFVKADAAGIAAIPEGGLEGGVGEGGRGRVQAAGRAALHRVGC